MEKHYRSTWPLLISNRLQGQARDKIGNSRGWWCRDGLADCECSCGSASSSASQGIGLKAGLTRWRHAAGRHARRPAGCHPSRRPAQGLKVQVRRILHLRRRSHDDAQLTTRVACCPAKRRRTGSSAARLLVQAESRCHQLRQAHTIAQAQKSQCRWRQSLS